MTLSSDFLRSFNSRQNWSFPDSIVYYILQNPSTSKVYEKLIQSCKYFFIKNSILVIPTIYFDFKDGWKTTISCIRERCVNIYKTTSKIWITKDITNFKNNNEFSSLIPKIFKCDIIELHLAKQNISFIDFIFLTSKCERIWFNEVTVMNENDTIIPLEKIIDVLPYIKHFDYYSLPDSKIITSKTMQKLIEIPHFKNIAYFQISDIPENFDISTFFGYLKKNMKTKFRLTFSNQISETYKNRLQSFVDKIVAEGFHCHYKVPLIDFHRISDSSREKLNNIFIHQY